MNQQERINFLEKQFPVNDKRVEIENDNQQYCKLEAPQSQNQRKSKSRTKPSNSEITENRPQSQSQLLQRRQSMSVPIIKNFPTYNSSQVQ